MFFQTPKSTPPSSFLTIQRRNMLSLLQEELFAGVDRCFLLRAALSSHEKK